MLRVAICDDDLKFTGQIEALVFQESQKLGIRVETEVFSDGKTLLNSIQNGEHYQLIFIDIEMEQVDGITAARCIREIDRTVLLIYVSGYDNYLKELFEVEPFHFLPILSIPNLLILLALTFFILPQTKAESDGYKTLFSSFTSSLGLYFAIYALPCICTSWHRQFSILVVSVRNCI